MNDLEARITRLEDIEAIRQLKASYCDICDDNHNLERITSVFTEDAIWEGKGVGHAQGHEQIIELFRGFQTSISYSQHMVVNPIITIDGEQAHGVWYFFGAFTFKKTSPAEAGQAMWQAARYHEDYVKIDGQWKIKHLRIKGPGMSATYEKGWAR